MNNNTTTMSIYAEALINNREYKSMRINGEAVGVSNARAWMSAVKSLRIPAYAIREYRYNHMGDAETVVACDQSTLYEAIRKVLDMIGVVNGAKLDAFNVAEEVISSAMRFRVIDTSNEMAHARAMKKSAKEAMGDNPTEEDEAEFEKWSLECKRLEALPGNCKKIPDIQSEGVFVKTVEMLLGDAIKKQKAKSVEEIMAEIKKKEEERKAKAKANKKAQRQAKAQAESK